MTDPAASVSTGLENIVISNDPPETSEHRNTMQHDEHIARLTQEIEDLRSELNRVRDLTNLSVTLQSPPPEPRTVAPNPPRFPSLESPVPEHFPPQNNAPTNNNFPPPNPSSVYTPPQNQPPTYNTYATPNPPPVNPPNQSQVHTPYIPLPTNTNPPLTTTPLNPPNQLPTNTMYNTPPPIHNTPAVQTYPTQRYTSGTFCHSYHAQDVPPVYAAETQAYTNPVTVRLPPEVDQYEKMEKEAKARADDMLLKEIHSLKEAMRNLQVARGTKSVEYEDLCVQPDVDLPVGYKPPKFDTFNGTGDPHTHLRAYCDKLVGVGRDRNIRMKLFIEAYPVKLLHWYTQQDVRKWRGWSDMAQDFMDRFSFNTDITPDRVCMSKLTKKSTESFREYRRVGGRERRGSTPMNDREMTATFIECQAGIFYEKMIGMMGQKFTEVVRMGEALEEGIKSGKIQDLTALQAVNKAIQSGSISGTKKKKEDAAVVMNVQGHKPSQATTYFNHPQPPFYPYHYVEPYQTPLSPYPVYNAQVNYYQPRTPPHQNPRPYQPVQAPTYQNRPHATTKTRPNTDIKNTRNYTRFTEPLAQLFERLKAAGVIQPIEGKILDPIPRWFDGSKHCAYHSGVAGHDTEDCYGLKNKIEALIKEGAIQITGARPNVDNNPLPTHENANVNMVTVEEDKDSKRVIMPIEKDKSSTFAAPAGKIQKQAPVKIVATTSHNTETPTIRVPNRRRFEELDLYSVPGSPSLGRFEHVVNFEIAQF
ncbi:uncharacterized protein LOC132031603 [Lycium ferocissimum]|uniref:uncharacterized protein LOC132031603 n=1 Tax=Lycium ferocissimum TaxID=112874 RepID=UPI00281496C5|nr:uncharacterized protein LOC132031603 [Lycium ferocissimum]